MIETKILGAAVGIQRQSVIDKTEGVNLPSVGGGVIVGRFKRGCMNKPFTVTRKNYRALLGHDPSNPSYQAVEDVFNRGVSQIDIRRVGDSGKVVAPPVDVGGGGGVISCTPTSFGFTPSVTLPPEKEQLILRYTLEIDGEQGFLPMIGWDKPYREIVWTRVEEQQYGDSANLIATSMFLDYWGGIREHIQETFITEFVDSGDYLLLSGHSVETISESDRVKYQRYSALPANVKITFVVIDDLPIDAIDYTLVQFGGEIVINGCAVIEPPQDTSA